jgi:hypothetical protein
MSAPAPSAYFVASTSQSIRFGGVKKPNVATFTRLSFSRRNSTIAGLLMATPARVRNPSAR